MNRITQARLRLTANQQKLLKVLKRLGGPRCLAVSTDNLWWHYWMETEVGWVPRQTVRKLLLRLERRGFLIRVEDYCGDQWLPGPMTDPMQDEGVW